MAITLPKASPGSMGRARKAVLPDAGDVQQAQLRTAPAATVPNVPQTGGQEIGASLFEVGVMLQKAQDRETDRNEAVDRLRLDRAHREATTTEALRLRTEGDLTNPSTLTEFGKFLDEQEFEILQSHTGRPDSKLKLLEKLQTRRLSLADTLSAHAADAQQKMVASEFGEEINQAVSRIKSNPASLADEFTALSDIVSDLPLSPEAKIAQKNAALSVLAETSAVNLIGKVKQLTAIRDESGSREAAQVVQDLLDNPSVARAMTPKKQLELSKALQDARTPAKPAELVTLTGPDGKDQTFRKDDPRVDALIERGFVTRPAQPAPERTESIERAKLAVKMEEKVDAAGREAPRTIAEIDRMEAAIESKRFTTGAFADAFQFIARVGERLGVQDEIKGIVGEAKTADVLDAASKRLGIAVADRLGGRVTNVILKFIEDSVPALTRTPDGNKILLKTMRRIASRDKEIFDLKEEFLAQHDTLRPKGKRSFQQAVSDLEASDPIINEELRNEISKAADIAPKTFKDIVTDGKKLPRLSTPDEVNTLEPGAEYIWKDGQKYRKN